MNKSVAAMQRIANATTPKPKSAVTVAADMERAETEYKATVEAARKYFYQNYS